MRIAYVDLMTTKGHRDFNVGVVKALMSTGIEVKTFGSSTSFPEDYVLDTVIPERFFPSEGRRISLFRRKILELERVKWVLASLKKQSPWDCVLIGAFETFSFSRWSYVFSQLSPRVLAFLHYNIDDVSKSLLKQLAFRSIDPNVRLLVLEPFILDYLTGINLKNKVFFIPQILECSDSCSNNEGGKQGKLVFAPSGSNSEELLTAILKTNDYLVSRNITVIMKGAYELSQGNVIVKKYFDSDQYAELMKTCDCVLVAFRRGFNFRVSGVVMDALCRNKPVIATTCEFTEYMKSIYGNPVFLIQEITPEQIIDGIDYALAQDAICWNRNLFCDDHSVHSFIEHFMDALEIL